jgi:SAM-dependent methyltransferase
MSANSVLDSRSRPVSSPLLARLSRIGTLRKGIGRPFLRANEWVWNRMPCLLRTTRPLQLYGSFLHSLVLLRSARAQSHGTLFLRNRPELKLLKNLVNGQTQASTLKVTVLGCSNGAEVYSFLWTIRSARPDLKVIVHALDISSKIVAIAKNGQYSLEPNQLLDWTPVFERLTPAETEAIFDRVNGHMTIKPWIREGIQWQVADAGDPNLLNFLDHQDIVVANRFLCHMAPVAAEQCLRNIAGLVAPGGYLFVSGVDLDLRTRVARDLGWMPVPDLIEDIHNGDPSLTRDWPWKYWGLEPFTRKRHDWRFRYASVFQSPQIAS